MNNDEKKILIERLRLMPQNRKLVMHEGSFNRKELINEVNNETQIGEFIVNVYMNSIRSFKKDLSKNG